MEQSFDEQYKNLWETRYGNAEYAYGKHPNEFFKVWMLKFAPGRLLMPADGEGRNGVFAAEAGWDVTSFDLSDHAKQKALALAHERGVELNYLVGSVSELTFGPSSFDAIGLIYAHFAADKKSAFHMRLSQYLRPGGIVIFEAFSKRHLEYIAKSEKVGGPRDINMLFSKDELLAGFPNYEVLYLEEEETSLEEGKYHNGNGCVIRFVGRKV